MKGVHKQAFAKPLASVIYANSQTAQERRWDRRVPGEFLADLLRKSVEFDGRRRQRIEASDCRRIVDWNENVRDRDASVQILSRLSLEVSIESGNTAIERLAIVGRSQRFDDELRCDRPRQG